MTVLDRAFIKAYQIRQPQPVPAADATPEVAPRAAVDPAISLSWSIDTASLANSTAESGVAQDSLSTQVSLMPPGDEVPTLSKKPSVVPSPHVKSWATVAPASNKAPTESPAVRIDEVHPMAEAPHLETLRVQPTAAPATTAVPAPEHQAEATNTPPVALATGVPAAAPANAPTEQLLPSGTGAQPHYEVDKIRWPEVCSNLLQLSPQGFDAMAERLFQGPTKHPACLITSRHRGEGRKTVICCLAQRLAQQGRKVLLVDADFGKAGLAHSLRLSPVAGWNDVLQNRTAIEESLILSLAEAVTVMPMTRPHAQGEMALISLIERVRFHWDNVLIDAGPWETEETAGRDNFWRRLTDARGLIVRDVRNTEISAVMQTGRHLETLGIRNWSITENFSGID